MQSLGPVSVLERKQAEQDRRESTQGVQVRSKIGRVRVSRLAIGHYMVPRPNYDLGADLQEISRKEGELKVRYSLYLDTFPSIQRVELQGTATVLSSTINAHGNEDVLNENLLSDVALEIFRNHYQTIHLLFNSMRLPCPSPWIVKDVHLV